MDDKEYQQKLHVYSSLELIQDKVDRSFMLLKLLIKYPNLK